MKIFKNQLKLGMILYSVPTNFDNPNPDSHKVFVVCHNSKVLLIPSRVNRDTIFKGSNFDIRNMERLDFYTTWETALIAAKIQQQIAITSLVIKENKIQVLIDNEREKYEI